MNWTLLAAALPALMLVWRLALDFIPMYPLNDLSRRYAKNRNREWVVHYAPLALALLLHLGGNRFSASLGLLIVLLYAAVHLVTCWLPYWKGGTDSQHARFEHAYGRTHRILPKTAGRMVPDTSHLISSLLIVLMVVISFGHVVAGPIGSASEPTAAAEETTGKPADQVQAPPSLIESAFTQAGQKPEELLIETIGTATHSLDIAISTINHDDIVKAILDARIRNVQVRIITDRSESAGAAQAEKIKILVNAGIPVKENSRKGLMNLKLSLIDDRAAATGSFNYTVNAATNNDEMLVIVRDPEVVKQWKDQFEAMWNNTEDFRDVQ